MVRDRIKELRRVSAGELQAHPKNWRTHPARQRAVMETMLDRIGYANALVAREDESTGELIIIDGHLRAESTPDQEVPVLVLDVSEDEAEELLASFDPLAALAEADESGLERLLQEIASRDDGLRDTLAALGEPYKVDIDFGDLQLGDDHGGEDFTVAQLIVQLPKANLTPDLEEEVRQVAQRHGARFSVRGARE